MELVGVGSRRLGFYELRLLVLLRAVFGLLFGGFALGLDPSGTGETGEEFFDALEVRFLAQGGVVAGFFFDLGGWVFVVGA